MWIVTNDALLTNCARVRRGMALNDTYVLCGTLPETTLHVLCDYVMAKDSWISVGNSVLNKKKKIYKKLQQIGQAKILRRTLEYTGDFIAPNFCDSFWYNRNQFVFEGNIDVHSFLSCKVLRMLRDYERNLNAVKDARRRVPTMTIKNVSWIPTSTNLD